MKGLLLTLILGVAPIVTSFAEEGPSRWMRRSAVDSEGPWLGVDLARLDDVTAAHLHEVPTGFGLLVEEIEADSPAMKAGFQPLDVIWKFEDQLIANRGQLYSLMKMRGSGATVDFSISRKSETVQLSVTLGKRLPKKRELERNQAATEMLMPPIPGMPIRQVDYNSRSGFIEEGDITVSLTQQLHGFQYAIMEGEKELDSGVLISGDQSAWPDKLEDEARRKLAVLFQSIAEADERKAKAPRTPRVRRVPTQTQ